MGSVTKIEGVIRRGGDVPVIDPHRLVIVGYDERYRDACWFAFCPRADEPVDEAFLDSIRLPNEVRDPIHVCRDGDRVVVLDGRRRVKAARIIWDEQAAAGVPEHQRVVLRFLMSTGTPAELFRVNRSSHDDRKELTALQRALLMAHYAKHVDGLEPVAEEFRCTVQTVRNALALLDCSERVQQAIGAGTIAPTAAARLAKLPRAEQDAKLEQMIARGATRGSKADEVIRDGGEGAVAPRLRPIGFFARWRGSVDPTATEAQKVAHAVLGFALGDEHALDAWPELQEQAREALKRRRRDPNAATSDAGAEEEKQEVDPRQLALVN